MAISGIGAPEMAAPTWVMSMGTSKSGATIKSNAVLQLSTSALDRSLSHRGSSGPSAPKLSGKTSSPVSSFMAINLFSSWMSRR